MKKLLLVLLLILIPSFAWPANIYYVKTGGNDASAGTSDGTAWATIAKVIATVTSGDTVYFRSQDTWNTATGSGDEILTTTAGVTYDGSTYGTGTRAKLQAAADLNEAVVTIYTSNVTITGFEIDVNTRINYGIGINGPVPVGNISNITVNNCVVHDVGRTDSTKYGIIVASNGYTTDTVTVTNCTIYNTCHEGLLAYASYNAGDEISNVIFRGNTIYNTGVYNSGFGDGILIKNHVTIATVEFNYSYSNDRGLAFETYSGINPPTGIHVRYNLFKSNRIGIWLLGGNGIATDYRIYGNLIVSSGSGGGISLANDQSGIVAKIYNNTIYDIGGAYGIVAGYSATGSPTVEVKNNIVYTDNHTCIFDGPGNTFTHNNNLYYRTSGASGVVITNGASDYSRTQVTSYESTAQNTDPAFSGTLPTGFSGTYGTDMVPNQTGLYLTSGPVINNGATLGSPYNGCINGAGLTTPTARPQGAAYDIGAYELLAGTTYTGSISLGVKGALPMPLLAGARFSVSVD